MHCLSRPERNSFRFGSHVYLIWSIGAACHINLDNFKNAQNTLNLSVVCLGMSPRFPQDSPGTWPATNRRHLWPGHCRRTALAAAPGFWPRRCISTPWQMKRNCPAKAWGLRMFPVARADVSISPFGSLPGILLAPDNILQCNCI